MSTKEKKHHKKEKEMKEKMRTRNNDSSSRKTMRSSLHHSLNDDLQGKKKKKKTDKPITSANEAITKKKQKQINKINESSSDSDSEHSRGKPNKTKHGKVAKKNVFDSDESENSDNNSKNSDTVDDSKNNELDSESNPDVSEQEEEIDEKVQSNDSDTDAKQPKTRKERKLRNTVCLFSGEKLSALQYYARNTLFQKIKVLDEHHLDINGKIIGEALKHGGISIATTPNINAYVTECRQLLKKCISSRRGYVKRQIGLQLKSLVKNQTLELKSLQLTEHFYNPDAEGNPMIRRIWHIYCLHFLTKINKDWNTNLQPARLRKKAFMFDYVTTSDEAMILWFLKVWAPKIDLQAKNGWPAETKAQKDREKDSKTVEQELKAGLKDYVAIHHRILENKKMEQGAVAIRWNDIFWEEMVSNNPSAFVEPIFNNQTDITGVSPHTNNAIVVLPDADDDNDLLQMFQKQKSYHAIAASNSVNTDGLYDKMQSNEALAKVDTTVTLNAASQHNTVHSSLSHFPEYEDINLSSGVMKSPEYMSDNDPTDVLKVHAHPI